MKEIEEIEEEETISNIYWDAEIKIEHDESDTINLVNDLDELDSYERKNIKAEFLREDLKEYIHNQIFKSYNNWGHFPNCYNATWHFKINELTSDKKNIDFYDLSECSQEHILKSAIQKGYLCGQFEEINVETEKTETLDNVIEEASKKIDKNKQKANEEVSLEK